MRWNDLLPHLTTLLCHRAEVDVRGVQYDSRRVSASDVFVAMRGGSTDGNRFVDTAIKAGAAAIVTDRPEIYGELRARQPELALALVDKGRRGLAEASAALFGHPEQHLAVTGITGTNGKTTTAWLLEQLLTAAGRRCLLVGTIETHIAGQVRATEHTTPESRDLYALFAEAVRGGCTEVVMEMSSHALDQERVWGIPVDVAIFTNLTQDHLDYHRTMEAYARAKARLFEGVGSSPPRVAVINEWDNYAATMIDAYAGKQPVMRYSAEVNDCATHYAEDLHLRLGDTHFTFVTPEGRVQVHSPLTGRVNAENLLAAMCAARARGLSLEQIAAAANTLKPAPGRFEVVSGSQAAGFTVVVDYAHTDDALTNLLRIARDSVSANNARVITLFGCGGDRDRTKRPKMGRAAAADSDFVVVTSDSPRSEEPMSIINEVTVGMREELGRFAGSFVVEPDRGAAIEVAIRAAHPGDIVLLAGKGHEKTQTFADHTVAFDDIAEAERVLAQLAQEARQ